MAKIIVVAHLPHLPLACLPNPQNQNNRVAVLDDESIPDRTFMPRAVHRIIDADEALWARRILPAMRLIDAQQRAPGIAAVVVKKSILEQRLLGLAELLLRHSPVVEPVPPTSIALDLTGHPQSTSLLLRQIEETLEDADVGPVFVVASPGRRLSLALAKDAARSPVRYKRRRHFVVDVDSAARARERIAIDAVGLDPVTLDTLMDLGVKTTGDLRALIPGGAAARLVEDARTVLRLFDPAIEEPLSPLRPPEDIVERVDLDDAIAFLEPLRFVMAPLCERVVRRALARGQKIAAVAAFFAGRDLVSGRSGSSFSVSLEFPEPLHEARALLNALCTRLEYTGIPGPVERITLKVLRAGDGRRRQQDAFRQDDAAPAALSALLAELATELGPEHAGCLRVVRSLLPEQMTALSWPPPKPKSKKKNEVKVGAAREPDDDVADGHFLAAWPWPVRMLREPLTLEEFDLAHDVVDRLPFARLEGEDDHAQPFCRSYEVILLRDGRWLLAFVDPGVSDVVIAGWFD